MAEKNDKSENKTQRKFFKGFFSVLFNDSDKGEKVEIDEDRPLQGAWKYAKTKSKEVVTAAFEPAAEQTGGMLAGVVKESVELIKSDTNKYLREYCETNIDDDRDASDIIKENVTFGGRLFSNIFAKLLYGGVKVTSFAAILIAKGFGFKFSDQNEAEDCVTRIITHQIWGGKKEDAPSPTSNTQTLVFVA